MSETHSISLLEEQQSLVERKNIRSNTVVRRGEADRDEELINAVLFCEVEKVRLLLDEGANPNYVSVSGYSPLFWSVTNRQQPICELLVRKGADVNARDLLGWTPLCHAVSLGDESMIKYLVSVGSDVSIRIAGNTDLTKLAKSKRVLRLVNELKKTQRMRLKAGASMLSMTTEKQISFEGVPDDIVQRYHACLASKEDLKRLEQEIEIAEAKRTVSDKDISQKCVRVQKLQHDIKHRQNALQLRLKELSIVNLPVESRVTSSETALQELAISSAVEKINIQDIILGNQLGSGGFATVYRAFWHGDAVAVKVVNFDPKNSKGSIEEFKKETLFLA